MVKGNLKRKSLSKKPHHKRPQLKLWLKKRFTDPQERNKYHLKWVLVGGGRGKRGGGGGKKPPEDKIEFEELYKKYDNDDSSTETSLELEVTPEQLSRMDPNRPVIRLRLSPR